MYHCHHCQLYHRLPSSIIIITIINHHVSLSSLSALSSTTIINHHHHHHQSSCITVITVSFIIDYHHQSSSSPSSIIMYHCHHCQLYHRLPSSIIIIIINHHHHHHHCQLYHRLPSSIIIITIINHHVSLSSLSALSSTTIINHHHHHHQSSSSPSSIIIITIINHHHHHHQSSLIFLTITIDVFAVLAINMTIRYSWEIFTKECIVFSDDDEVLTIEGGGVKYKDEHDDITLTCRARELFIGHPTWRDGEDRLITNTSRVRITHQEDLVEYRTLLHIFDAQVNDSGRYTCEAVEDNKEKENTSTILKVLGK